MCLEGNVACAFAHNDRVEHRDLGIEVSAVGDSNQNG